MIGSRRRTELACPMLHIAVNWCSSAHRQLAHPPGPECGRGGEGSGDGRKNQCQFHKPS